DVERKLFSYIRYNAELSRAGLDALDCQDIEPASVQKLDSVDGISELRAVGRQIGQKKVLASHFDGFPSSETMMVR
ncbi:hypothetical protein QN226_27885, partial [Sinorhizobium sp. 6-117]|nr:hypothetical protein [Sinorhizobium sp. 6-117]